jgi:hypothetical protein
MPTATVRAVEQPALLTPARRQRPLQLLQNHALIRLAREDDIGNVGRQQRQPQVRRAISD